MRVGKLACILLALTVLPGLAQSQHGHVYSPQGPQAMSQTLDAFPAPRPGMSRHVINLPQRSDESAYMVGLTAGKMMPTDGVNQVRMAGELTETTLQGWGYTYYELPLGSGNVMSTLIGVPAGHPRVTKFVSVQEKLVRYNSRLPLVVYVPDGFEVKYRIFSAGPQQTAQKDRTYPTSLSHNKISLSYYHPVSLPEGAVAILRLYDSMLMDTDSTYGLLRVPIRQLPVELPAPEADKNRFIAGPAIGVSIEDQNGRLLYHNDVSTPFLENGKTHVKLINTR